MILKFNFIKQVVVVLTFVFMGIGQLSAQSEQEEVELFQAIFGMEKKAVTAEFIDVDENASFWGLYDAYEIERKELGKKRLGLLQKYANNYEDMSGDVADILIKDMQSQKKQLDKLIDTYYKKIKKDSGSKVAAQFYQLENYILSEVRTTILESIPFIGELDN